MTAEWMDDAACKDVDPEAFFADEHDQATTAAAKRVCAGCPVVEDCLRFAVDNFLVGVWAGTTDRQRRAFRNGSATLIPCPECGQKFANRGAVAAHISHRHTNARGKTPTRCEDCGRVFKSRQGMANHRTYAHKKKVAA